MVRDDHGSVMVSFERWSDVVDEAYNQRVQEPIHLVSDGDRAIAGAMQIVYGSKTAHQLCQFHLLQEYRRSTNDPSFGGSSRCACLIVMSTI